MGPVLPVIVHLDTSVLIDSLAGPRRSFAALERMVMQGQVIATSTLALTSGCADRARRQNSRTRRR